MNIRVSSISTGEQGLRLRNAEWQCAERPVGIRAFSLLEVMIAAGIFFMAIFTILALVSSTLRNARVLRRIDVDAGMVAAQLFRTNRVYEGRDSGDFGDFYRDYSWQTDTYEIGTNGLWQVDIVVTRRGLQNPVSAMSVWVFSPDSSALPFGGGLRR